MIIDKNLVFVSYPPGAGGWFLCALAHYFYYPDDGIKFDTVGSGHANKNIRQFNDMYSDGLQSDFGKAIINGTSYDKWTKAERIEQIQAAEHPFTYDNLVISTHLADLNIVHESFSNAKFIKIDIEPSDVRKCRYNMLYKRMTQYPEFMKGLAEEYGKDPEEEMKKLFPLTAKNLDSFYWIDAEILRFKNDNFNTDVANVLNITYSDLLTQDEEVFLDTLLEFLDLLPEQHVYETALDALMRYRLTQPRVPQ